MAIYDNLPYTNFHELNAMWLIRQADERKAKIEEFTQQLEQFEEDYQALLALANALSISGSNVTVAGSLTANGLIGNLTGNVTGNLNGNAATTTHATSADSATNATNATNAINAANATYATSAGTAATAINATNATNATYATNATNASYATTADSADESDVTSDMYVTVDPNESRTDMNDYLPTDNNHFQIFKTAIIDTNYPGTLTGEMFIVLAFKTDLGACQIVFAPPATYSLWYRVKVGGQWQSWHQI